MKRIFSALLFFCFSASLLAAAKTEPRLLLSAASARPGETVWVGIELKMPSGWHTYWRNGGDAGVPTKVVWTLPDGVKAGELQWPVPEKLATKAGDITLITYVYNDVAVLLAPLQLPEKLQPGTVEIKARVSWQECQEVCVLGRSNLTTTIEIGPKTAASTNAAFLDEWRKKVPRLEKSPAARASWESSSTNGETRRVLLDWERSAPTPSSADFFPYAAQGFEVGSATEHLAAKPGQIVLRKTVSKASGDWPASITGILLVTNDPGSALEVTLPLTENTTVKALVVENKAGGSFVTFLQMTLFAFLGGLILNIMPCVLPVISLKVLGFVNQSGKDPRRLLNLGLIYGLGILLSFAALAAIAILFQSAGGLGDWGSAFRNPQFRIIITILITLVALNLFGVFEVTLGGRTMNAADHLASKQGYVGAFFNGVLATVLATPCTAPFLGTAILFAVTQPPAVTLWIFLSTGFGLAVPFVLVCWKPRLLSFLPKPGAWMEQFKVAMGFPMLVTAVWLFWLTSTRLGKEGVLWFGIFLVILAFAAWVWGQFVQRGGKRRSAAVAVVLLTVGLGYGYLLEGKLNWRSYAAAESKDRIAWQPWSKEAVEKARQEGHPALVDFTADSCLNCQFNKLTSLEIEATRSKLKKINAVAFVADYTDENPAIAAELARFHRAGVPLVVVFPSGASSEPIILPPILTPAIVLNALEKAAAK